MEPNSTDCSCPDDCVGTCVCSKQPDGTCDVYCEDGNAQLTQADQILTQDAIVTFRARGQDSESVAAFLNSRAVATISANGAKGDIHFEERTLSLADLVAELNFTAT